MLAIVRTARNGNLKNIRSDYSTKKQFNEELKGNGYRVLGIFTDKQIKEIKDGLHRFNETDSYEYIRQCL